MFNYFDISSVIYRHFSLFFGIVALLSFVLGFAVPLVLISHKDKVSKCLKQLKNIFGYSKNIASNRSECDICEVRQCQRHKQDDMPREPWKGLEVDQKLDEAVESFYTRILNSFVKSWFSLLSNDDDFIQTLKQGLREATCHIIRKLTQIDAANVLTYKILPMVFEHIEAVQRMLNDGVALDKLPSGFIQDERAIHPAVVNRQAELDYLRAVAKCLIPRLFHSENFDSKIFFSLVRELIACWVLLPLMDVISDPNLINSIIIHASSKSPPKFKKSKERRIDVEFLKNFVNKPDIVLCNPDSSLLNDSNKLYSFMQFLKKEGAVDILRFYLDVDNLNRELQDPKVTSDPAKLSSLYKQSEKLLQDYYKLVQSTELKSTKVTSLSEAHDKIRITLEGKWQKAFSRTPEYFGLLYGSREIKLIDNNRNSDQSGAVSRLGSKLKDVFRGAIDGAPLDATEVPTVWDAFNIQEPQTSNNQTIYNSVAQKLRKERGQNLDAFLMTFLQSLDDSVEVQEEVKEKEVKIKRPSHPPGRNLVFGNLFGLNRSSKSIQVSSSITSSIKGPSQCLLYIMHKLIKVPKLIVQLIFAWVCIAPTFVDSFICRMINKLIKIGLYEPRLAVLIRSLEQHLFDAKHSEVSPGELLERQRQARLRMEGFWKGTGYLADVLQSPALNKHLMYCIFDVILTEMYPEFGN